jgi:hypothetical protein
MVHKRPTACIQVDLLRYVRDARPSETQLLEWLGANRSAYYVLRKHKVLEPSGDQLQWSPLYLSTDGARFRIGNRLLLLDEMRELVFTSKV